MKLEQFLGVVPSSRPVSMRELAALGVSRADVLRFCRAGVLERLGRGVYMLVGADFDQYFEYVVVQQAVPKGVICLVSALVFHGMTNEWPRAVWVLLPNKAWRPRLDGVKVKYHYATGDAYEQGWEEHDMGGTPVRITTPAKTVADCFKYRNKLGIDLAAEALKDFFLMGLGTPADIGKMTRMLRVDTIAQPYVDAFWQLSGEYR